MAMRIASFSDSTLAVLSGDNNRRSYVYCLSDPRNNKVFYVGKGTGNRVFQHENFALDGKEIVNDEYGEYITRDEKEKPDTLKVSTIKAIDRAGLQVVRHVITYGLSDNEAFACENTLINFLRIVQGLPLSNIVGGHGATGDTVEGLERQFGYEPLALADINTDSLILAVKIRNSFALSDDETKSYTFANKDDSNLKSRTLGDWTVGKHQRDRIKYVIGVNTGIKNSVVSAYEVNGYEHDEHRNRTRFFETNAKSVDVLNKLGLYKKCLPDLTFGAGAAFAYINSM